MFIKVFNPFSKYVDRHEKKSDKLLRKVSFYSPLEVQKKVLELMQENLVVFNLWLEKEFKGYRYLNRWNRKKFYRNTQIIVNEFNNFVNKTNVNEASLIKYLNQIGYKPSQTQLERLKYLFLIMLFLKPGEHYEYLEGASFGKLLKDVTKEKMIGDCNQIVTFYTFMYAQKFQIKDLQIKLIPGHVCLHFEGLDIEATNGSFQMYDKFEHILPITEIISTNLLDISDARDKQLKIDSRSVVKAAELAVRISSLKDIVENNLRIAYHNLAIEASANNNFQTAKFFLDKMPPSEETNSLKENIYHNAVVYYCKILDFSKSRYYLSLMGNQELKTYISNQEGYYYFKNGNYEKALEIYRNAGNQDMVRSCYAQMYNIIQHKVANLKTVAEVKAHRYDYQKMQDLARKMGDSELENQVTKILNSI